MRAADSRPSPTPFVRALFAGLPARYDRLAAVLSLGQDRRWRREMIDHAVSTNPASVLDVATGPAGVALDLAARTDARITGLDVSEDMLGRGRRNVVAAGRSSRIALVLGQGERLPFPDSTFEAVTFTYLLRYVADPAATIGELARVLCPGGTLASLEFAVPSNRFWRAWWWLYTRAVLPVAGGLLGGRAWFDVGRFLGPNITAHYERAGYPLRYSGHSILGVDRPDCSSQAPPVVVTVRKGIASTSVSRSLPTSPHGRTQVCATSGCAE